MAWSGVVAGAPSSLLTAHAVNVSGQLTQIGSFPLDSVSSAFNGVAVVGDFVYVNNNRPSNTVNGYVGATTGALTPVPGFSFPTGGVGPAPGNFAAPRIAAANHLFVVNGAFGVGSNDISVFSINSDGSLTLVPGSPFPLPPGQVNAGSIAVNPAGTFLFAGTTTGNIVAFPVASSGVLGPPATFSSGLFSFMDGLVVHPSGGFLVAVFRSLSKIAVLNIAANGAVTPVSASPFLPDVGTGVSPAGGSFDAAGTFLFVGNQSFGPTNVSVYRFVAPVNPVAIDIKPGSDQLCRLPGLQRTAPGGHPKHRNL